MCAREIRRVSAVPIIMVTARVDETDRVLGLELGADDYVTKPFSPREVVARVRAVLRRTQGPVAAETAAVYRLGELALDEARHTVSLAGEPVELTPTEFEMLRVLLSSPGRVFIATPVAGGRPGPGLRGL